MGLARTVLGDIGPERLGVVLAHEHLIIDSSIVEREWPHIHLPSVREAIAESNELVESGVGTLVDAMPVGSGGDPERLAEVARATGLNVIASTGMHTARYYSNGDWHLEASAGQLAARFIDSLTGSAPRAGLVKLATTGPTPNPLEHRLFEAAAITSKATGAPLLTHCEGGQGGMAQLELLHELGVPLTRVAMSHTDKVGDPSYHQDLLDSGVSLCLDQGLRHPERTSGLFVQLVSAGFGAQLMIGTDGARRSLWSTLGGSPGLAWANTRFRDLLTERGLDETVLTRIYRDNPARWLTLIG